jgi:hypothetical protein
MLKYEDITKLERLGWIEYGVPIHISSFTCDAKFSIEVNSIDMVYFLLTYYLISFRTKYNIIL